jgi:hypothetical protein
MDMMIRVSGRVTIEVWDTEQGRQSIQRPNTLTHVGAALIANWLSANPTHDRIDAESGYIVLGAGYNSGETGEQRRAKNWVNTQAGDPRLLDAAYPHSQGSFGAENDHVLQFRATFPAGSFDAAYQLDEAALLNGSEEGAASCLAYAALDNAVSVSPTSLLTVTWSITFNAAVE